MTNTDNAVTKEQKMRNLKAYDIVNLGGKRGAQYAPLHKAIRAYGGKKTNDYNLPIHSGIIVPTSKGLRLMDLTSSGVKTKSLERINKEYKVSSVTRLKLNEEEKTRLHNKLRNDLNGQKVKYAVAGIGPQFAFGKKIDNKQVCSEYIANSISKTTRYSINNSAAKIQPRDLANPGAYTENGNMFANPRLKVIKSKSIKEFNPQTVTVKTKVPGANNVKVKFDKNIKAAVPKPAKVIKTEKV